MTRRLATTLFLLVVFGVVVAGIVGAAQGAGAEASSSVLEDGDRTFTGTTLEEGDERVAIVPIRGSITGGSSDPSGASTGSDDTVGLIDAIVESDDYEAILLELNTPGGGVLASAEITDALERAQDEGVKVVSWMRDSAASGGYYVAAGTDRIVASRETITGSIGVILQYVQVAELVKDIGVKPITIKSGKLKDIGSPFRDLTPEEQAVLQELIDESYAGFVDIVAEGRDLPESRVREIADGRIYTGVQAEEIGLVDELGLRADAYKAVAKLLKEDEDDLEVVAFDRSYSFTELLTSSSERAFAGLDASRAVGELVNGALRGDGLRVGAGAATPRAGAANSGDVVRLEYRASL